MALTTGPHQLGHFYGIGLEIARQDFMNNDKGGNSCQDKSCRIHVILKGTSRLWGWMLDLLGYSMHAHIVGKESGSAEESQKTDRLWQSSTLGIYGDYSGQLKDLWI
jgi:hypothetical protein